jgi:RNase P subunit RPR2
MSGNARVVKWARLRLSWLSAYQGSNPCSRINMKKLSKTEAKERIENFFKEIKNKSPREVKKIKELAMNYNIPLKEKRKLFCKNCFNPFVNSSIKIKNDFITITCEYCGYRNRWKVE